MSRRSLCLILGFLAVLVLLLGGGTLLLLRYEPETFTARESSDPARRAELSQEFLSELSEFAANVTTDRNWEGRFTDEQVNCYLAESFVHCGLAEKLLPEGISEPRIAFEEDRMHIAFRYECGLVKTVVTIDLRIWLPRNEGNALSIRFEGIRAGLVPFNPQWMLERIATAARENGIEVNWYRHETRPVAVLRFQADQARPTLSLRSVRFEKGAVTVHGSNEETRSALPAARDKVGLAGLIPK